MYQSNLIESYIEKINQLAEEAAQKIFDQHEQEFKNLVLGQLKKGDKLYLVNGSAYFKGRGYRENEKPLTDAMESFSAKVAHIQYLKQRASFRTYEFIK